MQPANPNGSKSNGHGEARADGRDAGEVRYGVVGLGWFAQAAILPAFRNARRNSRLAALFSGDAEKRRALGQEHGVRACYSYDQLEAAVRDEGIDALYLAVPNHLHRDFTLRAAACGAHVLCEKPMAVTEEDCSAMIEACDRAGVKLMVAYRLHFEQANLCAIERVESGRIGVPTLIEAVFSNQVDDPDNIRFDPIERGGGSLYDIGIYCINAARNIFRCEPEEVFAMSKLGGSGGSSGGFARGYDETTSAMLRFPGGRMATFSSSFGLADHDRYTVHGTEGSLRVQPAFHFRGTLRHRLAVGNRCCALEFPERDQIAPELLHFSDCILEDREPEPSGREGLADVRILRALHRSAAEGRIVPLSPFEVDQRPDLSQEESRPLHEEPELVGASPPNAS
ncbi:MAG TPA: Gfo/Idh/MocA family oxidoreductase [Thermoanaerobaculia bacterium]|nr:Gfo/Idh/MocA family oxidoreductase [Thermoanaerobaculia bacterium]